MVRRMLVLLITAFGFASFSLTAAASQDPTAPLGWQKTQPSKTVTKRKSQAVPKLQSIVCTQASRCSAVINDQLVLVGERVNGYRVSHIQPEAVTLTKGGKQWRLALFSLEVKQ